MENKTFVILLFLIFILSSFIVADEMKPFLTLNTDMHSGALRRIAVDSGGRYILSCSKDKTAKLWDAKSGDLIKTYRIPIDKGNEGMLYACALSPDGEVAALGGWTGYDKYEECYIYLYNTRTGEMTGRLVGMENVIFDIEYSPDGRYIAAALGAGYGVRIYNSSTQKLIKSLNDFPEACYNLAFDNSGRLAVVSYDGKIKLYNSSFEFVKEKASSLGTKVYSLSFSPDGKKLAVGCDDNPQIEVLDASNLTRLYLPDIKKADTFEQKLEMVCFSNDGLYLYAGGFFREELEGVWWYNVRRWSDAGKGGFIDIPSCQSTLLDIKPLPDNSVVFCSACPDLGKINSKGKLDFYKTADIFNFSTADLDSFKLSGNGKEVGFKPFYKNAMIFSITDRTLIEKNADFPSYKDSMGDIVITDWRDTYSPKLNGQEIVGFDKYECCRSVDIADNKNEFVIGSEWNLTCFSDKGAQNWKTSCQSVAWSVNISGNNKVVCAAMSDGTIRWYRMVDGKNILSLFAHPDKRWILWSESGYYDCSSGAEDLIGWHVNNGFYREGNFYPASKFRDIYYRPDIIEKIIDSWDENEAVNLANTERTQKTKSVDITKILPPTIQILKPSATCETANSELEIEYKADSPNNEPISSIRVFIDGRPIEQDRDLKIVPTGNIKKVSIPKRDCKISLVAENRFGFSEPAIITVYWKGASENAPAEFKPKLYILAVGISKYNNPEYNLSLPAKDAGDFVCAMKAQKGLLYSEVNAKVLTNKEATKEAILDGLEWLENSATSKDIAMVFLAGHGKNDSNGVFYFIPAGGDIYKLKSSSIVSADITNTVSAIAGKVVLFLDCCHAGNLAGNKEIKFRDLPDISGVVNDLTRAENGAIVFTASTGKQVSIERADWGNGAFTKALVEGLCGKADLFNKGKITVKTLDAYITERVKDLTEGKQSPVTITPLGVPDFPLSVTK